MPQEAIRRVSIVTGGALGIGGATSRRLAARGDLAVLNDIDTSTAADARAAIEAAGGVRETVIGGIVADEVVEAVALRLGDGRIDGCTNGNAIAPDLADSQQTPASAMLRDNDPAKIET